MNALLLCLIAACVVGCAHSAPGTAARPATAQPKGVVAPGPRVAQVEQCPEDPERAQQAALVAPADPSGWPAEVRLRMLVRQDGRLDCIYLVAATREGFSEACLRQVEGKRWRVPRDADGQAVAAWVSYLCQFDPKQ